MSKLVRREPEELGGYKTSDGAFWWDRKGAKNHQRVIDFQQWYDGLETGKLYGVMMEGQIEGAVQSGDLTYWILAHREEVLFLLGISGGN